MYSFEGDLTLLGKKTNKMYWLSDFHNYLTNNKQKKNTAKLRQNFPVFKKSYLEVKQISYPTFESCIKYLL